MSTFWCVGDSWSAGWAGETTDNVRRFFSHTMVHQAAKELGYTSVQNRSVPSASIGMITDIFLHDVYPNIQPGDVVFICAPPDCRFHQSLDHDSVNSHRVTSASFHDGSANYLESLLTVNTLSFFRWHYATFCKLIHNSAISKGAECYLQHNYGTLPTDYAWFNRDTFLDPDNSMWEWMGLPEADLFLDWCDGPQVMHLTQSDEFNPQAVFNIAIEKLIIDRENQIDLHPNRKYHVILGNKIAKMITQKRNNND